jgi:hypothetical protein
MQEFVGKVTKRPFGIGSKSEHDAVYLQTKDRSFVLRRQGGNPFSDPQLDRLVGKTIRCQGETADYTLIITEWTVLEG